MRGTRWPGSTGSPAPSGYVVGDVTSESDVTAFAGEVTARYGRVDVVVNNAGIACITPLRTPRWTCGGRYST